MFVTKKRFNKVVQSYSDMFLEYDKQLVISRDILLELKNNIQHIKNARLQKLIEDYFNDQK